MNEAMARKRVVALQRTGRLGELREYTGLSQGDVSRALNVSQAAVSRWESGKARPTGAHAAELLELLEPAS